MFKEKYYELINKAKSQNRKDGYFEIHHIIPRSLGGTNDEANLVKLTPEEHYDAHYYLWKFTNTPQMAWDFWLFNNFKGRKISKEEYGELRRQAAEASAKLQKKPVYCLELDMLFPSCLEATTFIGVKKEYSGYIGEVCNKKHKACFEWKNGLRYHWCWPEDIEEFKKHKEELLYEEIHRKELIGKKISKSKKGKPAKNRLSIICIEINKKFNSLKEAALFCNGNPHYLKLNAENGTPYHNYHWKLNGVDVELKEKKSHLKNKHLSKETKKKLSEEKRKRVPKIKCIELNKIFDCAKEAADYLHKSSGSYILEKARKGLPCYGYHWKIIEKEFKQPKIKCIELNKIFDNAKEAVKFVGKTDYRHLARCIRNKSKCYGYHWEFLN